MTKVTRFWDMHSGGRAKLDPVDKVYIALPQNQAEAFFAYKFGRDPNHVTCECCGEDYSVDEFDDIDKATEYFRDGGKISLKEYLAKDSVLYLEDGWTV